MATIPKGRQQSMHEAMAHPRYDGGLMPLPGCDIPGVEVGVGGTGPPVLNSEAVKGACEAGIQSVRPSYHTGVSGVSVIIFICGNVYGPCC